jgi:hypothetical protein
MFGKVFKEIADEYNTISWHEGHNKNFYRGFDVIGENKDNYYSLITMDLVAEKSGHGARYTNHET